MLTCGKTKVRNVAHHLRDGAEDNVANELLLVPRALIVNYNENSHVDVDCCSVQGYCVFVYLSS